MCGADLLSGPLDIAPCGAALGRRGRPRGPRAYQGAGIAGLVGWAPGSPGAGASWAAGGRPGGIGRQGRHRAGVWRRGGRRRVRRPGGQTAPWRPVWRSPGRLGAVGHPRYRGPGRAGRHPAAGHGLTWGVSNVLKRPDFSRFLSWCVEVRGATGAPRAADRQMVPRLGQKKTPRRSGVSILWGSLDSFLGSLPQSNGNYRYFTTLTESQLLISTANIRSAVKHASVSPTTRPVCFCL